MRRLHYIKIVAGLIIIVLSFVYIMKNHNKSMMDSLMEKRKKEFEEAQRKAETSTSDTTTN